MFYVCDGRRHLLRGASMAAPKDGGGGGRRRGEDGGGGAAPPARPQWRSFPGRGGRSARRGAGRGARGGARSANGRPGARCPRRPPASRPPGVAAGRRGLALAPGPGRPSPAFLWGAARARLRPPPLPRGRRGSGRRASRPCARPPAARRSLGSPPFASRGGTSAARRARVCGLGGGGASVTARRRGLRLCSPRGAW